MPTVYTNDGDVIRAIVTVDDLEEVQPVTVIPVLLPDSDRADWLAAYDPTYHNTPNATDSRIIARAVLDALLTTESG
jgi:hypothetical protein